LLSKESIIIAPDGMEWLIVGGKSAESVNNLLLAKPKVDFRSLSKLLEGYRIPFVLLQCKDGLTPELVAGYPIKE